LPDAWQLAVTAKENLLKGREVNKKEVREKKGGPTGKSFSGKKSPSQGGQLSRRGKIMAGGNRGKKVNAVRIRRDTFKRERQERQEKKRERKAMMFEPLNLHLSKEGGKQTGRKRIRVRKVEVESIT